MVRVMGSSLSASTTRPAKDERGPGLRQGPFANADARGAARFAPKTSGGDGRGTGTALRVRRGPDAPLGRTVALVPASGPDRESAQSPSMSLRSGFELQGACRGQRHLDTEPT